MYDLCRDNLDENAKVIHDKLDEFTEDQINITNGMLSDIILRCRSEWVADYDTNKFAMNILKNNEKISCELCGYHSIHEVFYIKNRVNNTRLRVGSSCITNYELQPFGKGKSVKQARKEYLQSENEIQLSKQYPELRKRLEKWNSRLNDYDVLIPINIETEYNAIKEKIKHEITRYIEGKAKNFDELELSLEDERSILKRLDEYNYNNKGKEFVATKEIKVWLERNHKKRTLEKLKQSGYVNSETIADIQEKNFVEFVLSIIRTKLKNTSLSVNHNLVNDIFVITGLEDNVQLKCGVGKTLSTFGEEILSKENPLVKLTVANVVIVSEPLNSNSTRRIIDRLKKKNYKSDIRILTGGFGKEYDYVARNEINLQIKRTEMVIVENLQRFIQEFKHFALDISITNVQQRLNDYVDKSESKKYTLKYLTDLRDTDFNKRKY
ncbi:hypothetical protein [Terribacillus saccharophilus]|uniref:Uncharacterized protein n=1 Tax=Terribacillus saccharophilus TaxID=361277 RepID=A0ABX4H110_9BACI|nr:hypothetical protein [Terribacillus saccharophilus]PAD36340.1 hypothetical protein CHH56_04935 [Terribacillus saccharophilus]PAD95018.1 hypothetical protein CHH50_15550 [Terribacillus saccharophilus]PAE00759.1 hypothetical protein CHH48_05640 [Terribacillus saccharophilus]